ncbi:hypothetical protein [Leptospira mtsangambouensis]|uniref:hypothetical protein n=1 Tax=Leptospira mtsangambouensis TaxID=2484912 RepID=UPI001EECDC7D|nr:hypothetical protein [Leptospira mtsangambouensis]MCG6140473.1 hypothetical protein [Leptospira mtsangambouensis]
MIQIFTKIKGFKANSILMKLKTLISIFFFSTSVLFAEESNSISKTFEYGLKAQNITYFPYETSSTFRQSQSNLKNNKDFAYLPFIKYRNKGNKFGFDFDMIDVNLNNPYFKGVLLGNNAISSTITYGNAKRQEFRFNFFYLPMESEIFYFGLGILKIDRFYKNQNFEDYSIIYSDKINSYGISLPLRSKIQLYEGLEINLGFDPYLTYGNRHYVNQRFSQVYNGDGSRGSSFYLTKTNPNNITEILGFQAEISLSYKFYENFRFYIGFSRNQSKIRSINFDQTNYSYRNDFLYITSGYTFEKLIDTHNSIYFGISNTH